MSTVTCHFYFINWQCIRKTGCMQSIETLSMWEVFCITCPYAAAQK